MTAAVAKQAYYRDATMKPSLARRYFRLLGDASTVLDVGCGTGEIARWAPPGVEVHGVDADRLAVELARRWQRTQLVDLDSEPLPFDDAAFDAVIAKDVLEHLREPAAAVREIARVVRPGGAVLASMVMAKPRAVWADYTHVRGFTRHSAQMLLEDVGLNVERVWRMGPVPLADRAGFMDAVPALLRVPGVGHIHATSWELLARR